jgi:hypothetical protein
VRRALVVFAVPPFLWVGWLVRAAGVCVAASFSTEGAAVLDEVGCLLLFFSVYFNVHATFLFTPFFLFDARHILHLAFEQ